MATLIKKFILFILASALVVSVVFHPMPVMANDDDSNSCNLSCIGDSFQQIFPFDIFSGIPQDGEFTCPSFTIFTRSFEICLFVDAISVLKYPVIAGLLIKVYLFS